MNWLRFGSAIRNEDYIEKLLKKFGIIKYNFSINGYGEEDLYIEYGLSSYKVVVREDQEQLWIYRKDSKRQNQKQCKEYFNVVKKIKGKDCWFYCMKYIKSQN